MKRTISIAAVLSTSFTFASWADAQECDRQCLINLADDYVAAMVAHDPKKVSLSPDVVMDDCVRFENGMQTARNAVARNPSQGFGLAGSLGCAAQLDTNTFEYITRIDNRRVWIADEVNGLAFGMSHFRHAFEKSEFRVFGIPGQTTRKMDYQPFDLPAIHIFKVWGGKIHEIEAIGFTAPYMSPTGWD